MKTTYFLTGILLVGLLTGCANWSNTAKGGVVGTAGGAALGAAIGKATGNTARGTIIGAAVGGTAGILIGRRMDKQAKEIQEDLKNARVERVGEGIVVTFDSGILFDFDRSELKPAARQNVSDLAQTLKKYEDTDISVIGHSDGQGEEDYNLKLSQRRAAAVSTYLDMTGVDGSRVQEIGKGESDPVASNDNAEGREQNRRVEIAIFANEKMQKAAKRGDLEIDN